MARSGISWEQVEALLDQVLDMDPEERTAFLDRLPEAGVDPAVEVRVREMIGALEKGGGPLDSPVGEFLGDGFLTAGPGVDDLAAGRRIGSYRIEAELGHGGMGRVFAAVRDDGEFTQEVALKVLRWEFADGRTVERFRAERQLLATLEHPGIARLIDGGITDAGLPYLVMERVTGTTIDRYCASLGLSLRERLELMREVCQVVEHAHRNLVVHRDLKPSNIMVTGNGRIKLLDFGIAKLLGEDLELTRDDRAPLTPNYGAPEQILGQPITPATDVYALGVILHELLTGVRPHEADSPSTAELARRVAQEDPPLPSVSARGGAAPVPARHLRGDLDSVVLKALARDPRQRYPSAERLGDDLRRHLENRPVRAMQAGRVYRFGRFVRRNRVVVGAACLLALSVAVGFASTIAQAERARAESDRARIEADRAGTVAAMLTDLFGLADPFVNGGAIDPRDLLHRGVADARERLSADPVTRASLLTALGKGFVDLGEWGEAHAVLLEATELAREAADADVLAAALGEMGGLELQRRRYDVAGLYLEEALATQDAVGPSRWQAVILAALARQRFGEGEAEAALAFSDSAIRVFRAWDPNNHAARLRAVAFRGPILRAMGDAAAAEAIYEEVLAEARTSLPATDQLVTATLNNLAFLRKELGDMQGAESAYREALALLENQVGPAHPDPVRVRSNLAALVDDDPARIGEAEALMLRNVAVLRDLGPSGAIRLEPALTGMTGAYLTWGMFERAEDTAREARDLTEQLPDGALVLRRFHELRLALAVARQGRREEARQLFSGAASGLRELGPLNSSGRGVLAWLAGHYEDAGLSGWAGTLRTLADELASAES